MNELNQFEIEDIINRLKKNEVIPEDFKNKLFPLNQKEFELIYGGKMRREDILANEDGVFPVPLQLEKVFNSEGSKTTKVFNNMIVFGDNLQFLKTIYENKDELIKDKVKNKVKLIYIDPPFGTGDEYGGNKGQKGYSAKVKGAEFIEFIRRRLILAREILSDDGMIFVRIDHHFGHYIKLVLDDVFGKDMFQNEFVVNRIRKNVTKQGRKNIPVATDSLFLYFKSDLSELQNIEKKLVERKKGYWHAMDSAGIRNPRERTFFGKVMLPPDGRHFTFTQARIELMISENKLRLNPNTGKPEYWIEPKDTITLDTNWTDIPGYTFTTDYPTENSEKLLERVIKAGTQENDLVVDFFGGSGTTAVVAEKLGRSWITCDIGKLSFYTMQKRLLKIESSRHLEKKTLKYGEKYKNFITVNTGYYDLEKVFSLKRDEYSKFVMDLFEVESTKRKISGVTIDGQKKDGYYCKLFPFWEFKDASVDAEYLEDLHSYIGEKIGNRFYIIAPANYVDFISDYYEIDKVKYYFLKVPYQIIKELHKVQFKKYRQPQRKSKVNDLDNAIGFHFMRKPTVQSRLIKANSSIQLEIKKFISDFTEEETGKDMDNFESLALVLLDINYNGKEFILTNCFFAEDLIPKKKKSKDEEEPEIRDELVQLSTIKTPTFPLSVCGQRILVIYVDIYGNEFKEELKVT